MSNFNTFAESVEKAEKEGVSRPDYFKFKEGENPMVILTNPEHFRTVYNIGVVYEGCEYNDFASSRYLCYIKDLNDGQVKLFEMSHTVAKQLAEIGKGYYTKFDAFPMPYRIIITAKNAGSNTVKYGTIAGEPIILDEADLAKLEVLTAPSEIVARKKKYMEEQMQLDPALAQKVSDTIAKLKEEREKKRSEKKAVDNTVIPTISYDEDDGIDYPEPIEQMPNFEPDDQE